MSTSLVLSTSTRVPGPTEWPLIGNLGTFRAASNLVRYAEDMWRRYGDVARMNIAGNRMVLLTHPDHIARVLLSERSNFVKGRAYDTTRSIMGDSLVTLDGSAWKERRSLAQPAFHRQALERLCEVMISSGDAYFSRWLTRMAGEPMEIDAHQEMTHLTLEVVVNALFGKDLIDMNSDVSFAALNNALELVSAMFNGIPLPKWLPTPKNLKYKRTLAQLDATVFKVIEAARKQPEGGGSLLSMVLDARDEQGNELPTKAVRDEVLTLFIAGHETTALTLTWLFALLDGRADVLRRMVQEVDTVLGGKDPTFADVSKLVYLRQVVDETLRLRPPGPMIARNVVKDTQFGGYAVATGETVLPFIWGVQRHPDFWVEPERFDPDRFAPQHAKAHNTWAYLPFSAGPRICIGNMFSLVETVILIAQLLNRFEVEVRSCADVAPRAIGTVRPSKPVRVLLKPRRRAA